MYEIKKDGYYVYTCSSIASAYIIAQRIGGEVEPDDDEYSELSEIIGRNSSSYE